MQTIQQQLKNASNNGCIPLEKALNIASVIDAEREETVTLLRSLERQVGMTDGEKINIHIANMNGTRFNERDYHFERLPGEQ